MGPSLYAILYPTNLVPCRKMSGSGWIGVPCVALCILFSITEVTQSQSVDVGEDHKVTGNLAA